MNSIQAKHLIENDEKFVYSKKFNYDLDVLLKRYPDGCPERVIASILLATEEEVEGWHQQLVQKLRVFMGVE